MGTQIPAFTHDYSPAALLDTKRRIPPYDEPNVGGLLLVCLTGETHRCAWPVRDDDRIILNRIDDGGTWTELEGAATLGTPVSMVWHAREMRGQDFYVEDYRAALRSAESRGK